MSQCNCGADTEGKWADKHSLGCAVLKDEPQIPEEVVKLLATALCCGMKHCNAINHCGDYGVSADTYAEVRGCESDDALNEARDLIKKAMSSAVCKE